MNRKPRLELLSPDLDLTLTFVPGYDLLEKKSKSLSPEQLSGIALTLWELSSSPESQRSAWIESQLDFSYEGGSR